MSLHAYLYIYVVCLSNGGLFTLSITSKFMIEHIFSAEQLWLLALISLPFIAFIFLLVFTSELPQNFLVHNYYFLWVIYQHTKTLIDMSYIVSWGRSVCFLYMFSVCFNIFLCFWLCSFVHSRSVLPQI